MLAATPALALAQAAGGAVVGGLVTDAASHAPIVSAAVVLEGTNLRAATDASGRYRIVGIPPGPQVLLVRQVGFAPARIPLTVRAGATIEQNVELARTNLRLQDIIVTADPTGRARGELGTASVIDRDAIANQTASSLAGVLELTPGIPLQAPGLDAVQQVALRSAPVSGGGGLGGPSAADLAAFGTLIVMDGVPLSNNANLQTLGPRSEFSVSSNASGGVDLRRIPAATLDRVEVIRGIPSARYGDLTNGAVVVDTRAGVVAPELAARYDARTTEVSLVGGRAFSLRGVGTALLDFAHTRLAPGLNSKDAYRLTTQLSHRASLGEAGDSARPDEARLMLDTRLDFSQLVSNNPEQPDIQPGVASRSSIITVRFSERARLALGARSALTLTLSANHESAHDFVQGPRVRGAAPFSDALTEGRNVGHYVGGQYLSRVDLDGQPRLLYGRLELDAGRHSLGAEQRLRVGAEARREWNGGAGYQFDIEFPPQVTFNGVQGYDRPRPFYAVPPVATSALYADDRVLARLVGGAMLDLQAGLRLDVLHSGTDWLSRARASLLQPRVNAQLSPFPWLRLRAGTGKTAKLPGVGSLYPALQYFDIVNVNWYTNNPAERLAVITTFIRDPTNPDLTYSTASVQEAGAEVSLGRSAAVSLVAFRNRTRGGVGFRPALSYLLRDRYQLSDSSTGTGHPPSIVEPPYQTDTIPEALDQPANILDAITEGWELTTSLPEWRAVRTRLDVQAALIRSRLDKNAIEVGPGSRFSNFQQDERIQRTPYWDGTERTGQRTLVTWRLVHHQPALGLVITLTVQHTLNESRADVAGTDTLSFAGYVRRDGTLVPVPPEQRADSAYKDLHVTRSGFLNQPLSPPNDWLMSFQVAKTLPLNGRLSFYAFNALDRPGRYASGIIVRPFSPVRFGLEVTMPLNALRGR